MLSIILTMIGRAMRFWGIMCILLIHLSSISVSAATQKSSQETGITINSKSISYADLFAVLKRQTGKVVWYGPDLDDKKKIAVRFSNASLQEVMDYILKNTDLTWRIQGEAILISMKKNISKPIVANPKLVESPAVTDTTGKLVDISGKVVDEKGNPIPGATVLVKGSNSGRITNNKGEFSINAPRDVMLVITSVGHITMEIAAASIRSGEMVRLKQYVGALDEVVIIPYGTSTRRNLTGSISRVTSEVLARQPISDPILALQGTVPGLQISQSSGIPGSQLVVRLRGQNSIASGNDPLYIIDGIPYPSKSLTSTMFGGGAATLSPFASISMSSIESIEILKDADATAIYGSRGANGVILITTKKGKQGKTKFDINVSTALGKIQKEWKLLNTQEYLTLRRQAFNNDGQAPQSFDNDVNGTWDTTHYTNWQKVLIGGTSKITNADITISGGSEFTQFIIGGSFRNESTVFPGDYRDRRVSGFINLNNISTNKKFLSSISASYLNDNNFLPYLDPTGYVYMSPNAPASYNSNGELNWQNNSWNNPIAILRRKSTSISTNLLTNVNLSYHIIPGLEVKTTIGLNSVTMNQSMIIPLISYKPSLAAISSLRKNMQATNSINTWNIEPQLTYKKRIGLNNINILLGFTFQETINKTLFVSASNFPTDGLIENIGSATSVTSGNTHSQYRFSSIFGRINYSHVEKYLINLTARRDGSSRFGPGRRFGDFGAVGVGWIFSNENLIKNNLGYLSFGKIRISYGTNGNDQINDYQYLSSYSSYTSPYLGINGLYPTRIANQYYSWESIRKWELGLDLGFLKDKVLINFDYYSNRTLNQLVGYSLSTVTGFESIQANLPAVIQNSGYELQINLTNLSKKDLTWKTAFSLSFPSNKLISYPNLNSSSYATTYTIGKSIFIYKSPHYIGINKATGIFSFKDINKDGNISSPEDLTDYKEISQKCFGSLQNSISYKNFQVDIFIQFVKQTGLSNMFIGLPGSFDINQPKEFLKELSNGSVPNVSQDYSSQAGMSYTTFTTSDGVVNDASFLRLKNVNFSYALPHQFLKRIHATACKLYIQGQNILTITKYKGIDPETRSLGALPPLRIINIGLHLFF